MLAAATKPGIGKVVEMLDSLALKKDAISNAEFSAALRAAEQAFPGGKAAFIKFAARVCRTSLGTIMRWRDGQSAPAEAGRKPALKAISDEIYRTQLGFS